MEQLRRPEPVSVSVDSTSFGFFTAAQARSLSVKRVTATEILDRLDNAVPDGLYDPAMGPTDPKGACTCSTCRLGYAHCPGHFGHIELPLPVYNPLVFGTVLRLLRAQCLNCFGFRSSTKRTAAYARKLRLLARGELTAAGNVQLHAGKPGKKKRRGGDDDDEEGALSEDVESDEEEAEAAAGPGPGPGAWTTHGWGEARLLMAEFLRKQPKACERCGCRSPALTGEAPLKIHRKPLGGKARDANARHGADVDAGLAALWTSLAEVSGGAAPLPPPAPEPSGGDDDADMGGSDGGGGEEGEEAEEEEEEEKEDGGLAVAAAAATAAAVPQPDSRRASGGDGRGDGPRYASAGERVVLLTPSEARELLNRLWATEREWVSLAYSLDAGVAASAAAWPPAAPAPARAHVLSSAAAAAADSPPPPPPPPDAGGLFMQTLLVPPNRLRPPSKLGEATFEHPQNAQYKAILTASTRLVDLFAGAPQLRLLPGADGGGGGGSGSGPRVRAHVAERQAAAAAAYAAEVATPEGRAARAVRLWLEIQEGVNKLLGFGGKTPAEKEAGAGIRQTLERKQGLFRMNMMGKRVNYAARSVISPDPFLAPGEVGVPPFIAQKLTIPELVTPINVAQLRAAVIAGAAGYPGATAVETGAGHVVQLAPMPLHKRIAIAKTLLTEDPIKPGAKPGWGGAKTVYRHMVDGDVMLTNRQPTLHKPGLMAHRARILKGQRTIRLHYANCAAFNADFDGDEINLHLPQEAQGRAEALGLVAADAQYTVPTDGKPLRGLIQDHVVAGVLLTQRSSFLTRPQFANLLYTASIGLGIGGGAAAASALRLLPDTVATAPPGGGGGRGGGGGGGGGGAATHNRVVTLPGGAALVLPPPAIRKPLPLWTGKQLLTSLLALLAAGRPALSCACRGKTPDDYWGANSGEDVLLIQRGCVVSGVLDKAAFTKYGFVHAVAELYGPSDAGRLLAALSRMLTAYLADHGFTCGLDDMALTPAAEIARTASLARADGVSRAAAEAFAFAGAPPAPGLDGRRPEGVVRAALVARLRERAGAEAGLDAQSTGPLNKITSATIKLAIPDGQVKPFRRNGLSLMTATGAKGGSVNFAQISALLGQQELEGRRVPRLPSGKTLPCFAAWDTSARAGGFIADRFLTGIRPQEYYFHCMAGREGLVDTAVKTSRSGYLQRCLVKSLEALTVAYDGTVRGVDGGVVQFVYGEDGIDPSKTGYARQFAFLAENSDALGALFSAWPSHMRDPASPGIAQLDERSAFGPPGLPPQARWFAASSVGAVSESYRDALAAYCTSNPERHLDASLQPLLASASASASAATASAAAARMPPLERTRPSSHVRPTASSFARLCELRHMALSVHPGEAVGVLAAQSVGEPSTQMTLNTFHFAGRGEANVTLGIPRLRELLMAAARRIGTPVMSLPVASGAQADAAALAARLRRVGLAELVSDFRVTEKPFAVTPDGVCRSATVSITVRCEADAAKLAAGSVGFAEVAAAFRSRFARALFAAVRTELRRAAAASAISTSRAAAAAAPGRRGGVGGSDDEGGGSGGEGGGGGGGDKGENDDDGGAAAAAAAGEEGEVGEPPGGGGSDNGSDASGDDEEGAKADARRGDQAGEGYTQRGADDGSGGEEEDAAGAAAKRRRRATALAEDEEEEEEEGVVAAAGGGAVKPADEEMGEEEEAAGVAAVPVAAAVVALPRGAPAARRRQSPPAPTSGRGPPSTTDAGAGLLSTLEALMASVEEDEATASLRCTLRLSLGAPKLLLLALAQRAAAGVAVRETPGIKKCYVLCDDATAAWRVQTDGINFAAAAEAAAVDQARVGSNDVAAVLRRFGVEAARSVLLTEVRAVFGAYGIGVDPRHLSLIADHMTHTGDYRPCSRAGLDAAPAPLLKMSFETATVFLTDAALHGSTDTLGSPSARIALGRLVAAGTGAFGLEYDLDRAKQLHAEQLARTL